ncbi:MAG: FHA domain-containing protein [Planctomycetota bacterium]
MKLEDLARESKGLDETAFVRRFPNPALVFIASSNSAVDDASKVDTPSGGIKIPGHEASFSRTNVMKATDSFPVFTDAVRDMAVQGGIENPGRELLGTSPVVFLAKSGRNPFESMITIGRATNNDHCLPLPTISKVHAYFSKTPTGVWRLTDQKATNGTWVDGQRLDPGSTANLGEGARLSFGPDARARFFTAAGLFGFLTLYRSGVAV